MKAIIIAVISIAALFYGAYYASENNPRNHTPLDSVKIAEPAESVIIPLKRIDMVKGHNEISDAQKLCNWRQTTNLYDCKASVFEQSGDNARACHKDNIVNEANHPWASDAFLLSVCMDQLEASKDVDENACELELYEVRCAQIAIDAHRKLDWRWRVFEARRENRAKPMPRTLHTTDGAL